MSDWLTIEEAAAEFHVHRTTFYDYLKIAKLPRYRRAGDRHRYLKRSDLKRMFRMVQIPAEPKS